MANLMLYGNGWTMRWSIAPGREEFVRAQLEQIGSESTARLPVIDPGSDTEVTLLVAWPLVAAAIVLDSPGGSGVEESAGQYA